MKKVTYYYCRHGQTLFNQLGRMQGWCDSPLTEEGIESLAESKEYLSHIEFAHCYSSTSERCVDTANIVLKDRDVPITYDKRLKEIFFGSFEGTLMKENLEVIDPIRKGDENWTSFGGENIEMVLARINSIFDEIYNNANDGDNILIVSHGVVFRKIYEFILNRSKEELWGSPQKVNNGYVGAFSRIGDDYQLVEMWADKKQ